MLFIPVKASRRRVVPPGLSNTNPNGNTTPALVISCVALPAKVTVEDP